MGGRRQTADHYAKRAKRERYPARSIYKLEEIDRRVRLLHSGDKVLDLGAYPGSWSLYAAGKVGKNGLVVAVDRIPIAVGGSSNIVTVESDALSIEPQKLLALCPTAFFDVVVSDMAPRTSGNRFVDQSRSFELFKRALELAKATCRPGGNFVGKIFHGEEFDRARGCVRDLFKIVRAIKPASVRSESYEIYLVGLGRIAEDGMRTQGFSIDKEDI